MKKRSLLLGVALLVAAGAQASAQDKIKIGFLSTFTGGGAIIGKHQKDGFELALDHLGRKIGGREVEIVYGDDQQKPDVGLQEARKFLQKDRVDFVVGVIWSNVLAAVQRPILRSKTIFITTNAGWSQMAGKGCNPYFFSTSWNNDQMPEAAGKLVQDEGVKNVLLMAANYQAGKDMINGFLRYYKGKVAGRILYKLGQSDFQAELSQIRAINPAAVYVFAPGGMGVAFGKQWGAAEMAKKYPLYSVFTIDFLTLGAIGKAAIGTYHTNFWNHESDNPVNQRFVKDYQAKYGYHPSSYSAQAYDAPLLLDSAVKAVGGDLSDKKGLVAALEKADFKSVRGNFSYNINHMPIQDFYKREVIAGPDGEPKIVTRGKVFANHKDAYYKECKMARP